MTEIFKKYENRYFLVLSEKEISYIFDSIKKFAYLKDLLNDSFFENLDNELHLKVIKKIQHSLDHVYNADIETFDGYDKYCEFLRKQIEKINKDYIKLRAERDF